MNHLEYRRAEGFLTLEERRWTLTALAMAHSLGGILLVLVYEILPYAVLTGVLAQLVSHFSLGWMMAGAMALMFAVWHARRTMP
jgi:hypothetical protein